MGESKTVSVYKNKCTKKAKSDSKALMHYIIAGQRWCLVLGDIESHTLGLKHTRGLIRTCMHAPWCNTPWQTSS